jgi:diguanylate cyclase (GGDEF)-like protein/putative nucleotidyltransferase with HDIG domain
MNPDWLLFGVLTILATAAQLFEAEHGRQSFYPHFVFFFAGVLLLPPALFFLLVIIPHLVEWAKERLAHSQHLRAWYIQPFNIATHMIAGMAAQALVAALSEKTGETWALPSLFVVVIAVLLYVATNHLLIGLALLLARRISLRDSGVFSVDSLLPDIVMACVGCIVAALWHPNPWWVVLALSPLLLMYKALLVPQLKHEAQTDGKTGLLNARHFNELFTAEFERARRFNRPLAFLMADLDLLRAINNTYGHLAGDAVLAGVAKIIRDTLRADDIPGRFGGEEFAIVLPETGRHGALVLAERLRAAIESAGFTAATNAAPIRATMSIGIACFPQDAASQTDLVHQADVAVYQAKFQGRNRVVCAADVPHALKLEYELKQSVAPAAQIPEHTDRAVLADDQPAPLRQPDGDNLMSETSYTQPAADPASSELPPTRATRGVEGEQAVKRRPFAARAHASRISWIFISGVIASGVGVALAGLAAQPRADLVIIGVLASLALLAELFQINVYGQNTVSVSVGVAFAMALVGDMAGVVCASTAIVLGHSLKRRPQFHRAAFNWATHVLAGAVPALTLRMLAEPLQLETLPRLAAPIALVAVAYYAVDTGLIAGAIAFSGKKPLAATWRNQFRWLAIHYLMLCALGVFIIVSYIALGLAGVAMSILPLFLMRYAQKQYVDRTDASMRELQRMNAELTNANSEIGAANLSIQQLNDELQQLNDELFETLARFFDARDPYVGGHAAKVADYAVAIAREMGLGGEQIKRVRQAAFLHDIGKIAIPEYILNKPGRLTSEEYSFMKTHAAFGADLLMQSRGLRHLAPMVRHHHERWDGQGYPDALRGAEIPLEARILNVCDSVEAMASDRPYHKGMSTREIIAEVTRGAGAQFDPDVAEIFIRVVEREGDGFIVNSAREVAPRQATLWPAAGAWHKGVVWQAEAQE